VNVWPLRFRQTTKESFVFADESGSWFRSDDAFLDRYAIDQLTKNDIEFLRDKGHAYQRIGDLSYNSFSFRWMQRQTKRQILAYVILVPTLRCNLSCTYCQVSRANENAKGYDWSIETLAQAIAFLDELPSDTVKVEFQGGEPLLRVDLLEEIRSFCRRRFKKSEYVVCTNLQSLGPKEWEFLEAADTYVSTSIDGGLTTHDTQRTQNPEKALQFFNNLEKAARRLGAGKLSALPTIDTQNPPDFETLVSTYEKFSISSIYLRPINYQGFARRKKIRGDEAQLWNTLHADFIDFIIERNFRTKRVVEEYYFSHCLKRVLRSGEDGHVDLRNPNLFATDYIVIDYDGKLYPTDECRMLSRIGHIDLSVGHVSTGIDSGKAMALSASSMNNYDPDCIHCPYQPFCGTDITDDISRYGRADIPKADTWFCQRHLSIFDKVFEKIYDGSEKSRFSLAAWAGLGSWPAALEVDHR
jgi:His-Xaa-Ser system radical SAM maturase HxsB